LGATMGRDHFEGDADAGESGGEEIFTQGFFGEDAHFDRRAGASVEHQVVEDFDRSVAAAVDQHRFAAQLREGEIVKFRKMLPGFPAQVIGGGHHQKTIRLQETIQVCEGLLDGRRDVFHHFA